MSKRSCVAAGSAAGAVCEWARLNVACQRVVNERSASRACTKLRTALCSEGAPANEQKELRSSGKRRRRGYTGITERWEWKRHMAEIHAGLFDFQLLFIV